MKGRRGMALMQVLVMALLALMICSAIVQSRLQPAVNAANAVDRVRDDLIEQSAINRVSEVWARLGSCASDPGAGVMCTAGSGCSCRCAIEGMNAAVNSSASGGACVLKVTP